MKKLFVALVAIIILATVIVYIFIPNTQTVEAVVKLPCVPEAAFRVLSHDSSWPRWWPGPAAPDAQSYLYANNRYQLSSKGLNSIGVSIDAKNNQWPSQMNLFALPGDSMLIRWHLTMTAGSNPLHRITGYRQAVSLKTDMDTILSHVRQYLSDFNNIYGVPFHEGSITDTFLITTKSIVATPPELAVIYSMIGKLKNFCSSTPNCNITGTPMLNITPLGAAGYQVMVALPVNHFIPVEGDISGIKMVPGKFIIADVTGGPQTIAMIHQRLLHYFQDYHRTAMAIPFEYLLTDRLQEPDTSKWRTRIYAPVY